MKPLPISVIVPLQRTDLYNAAVHPAIQKNNPTQIINITGPGNANQKRNEGASKATETYLFFCDDDTILLPYCLSTLYRTMQATQSTGRPAAVAYCNFAVINHPNMRNDFCEPPDWDPEQLRKANYISMMSLIRADAFHKAGGLDETIDRYQDWDLWLTMAEMGMRGVKATTKRNEALFAALYVDKGITSSNWQEIKAARQRIRTKHRLPAIQ
jgi:hypothetical protein